MKDFVNEKLIEIEKREDIKILYCADKSWEDLNVLFMELIN